MIVRKHKLSLTCQAQALGISRGSVYYHPRPVSVADLALMRRIDELHLDYPFAGSRMLKGLLIGERYKTGRLHVATLMKRMGIEAIYRRPNTSKPAPGHKIYPYLLRNLSVIRPNQVWAMDITYIPMAHFPQIWALYIWLRSLTGSPVAFLPGGFPSLWKWTFALKQLRKRLPGMASLTSLIPIRGRSSHPSTSSRCSRIQILLSQWTAKVPGAITSLSSGYGERSNMKKSICTPTRTFHKQGRQLANI